METKRFHAEFDYEMKDPVGPCDEDSETIDLKDALEYYDFIPQNLKITELP